MAATATPLSATTAAPTASGYASMDFCQMIRADHAAVRALLDDLDDAKKGALLATTVPPPAGALQGAAAASGAGTSASGGGDMERVFALARRLIGEVSSHASAEERVLYPMVKSRAFASLMGPSLAGGGAGAGAEEQQQGGAAGKGGGPTAAQQRDAEALFERVLADDQCNKELLQWLDRRVPGAAKCAAEGCEKPSRGLLGSGERGLSGSAALGGCGDVERALLLSTLAKFALVEREHMEMEEQLLVAPLEQLLSADEQRELAAAWRAAKEGAPVHPHPRGPVTAAAASIAHPAAAAMDKAAAALRAGGARVAGVFSRGGHGAAAGGEGVAHSK